MKKWKFNGETMTTDGGKTLHRIVATEDFCNVKAGEVEPIPKVVDGKPLDKKERERRRCREYHKRLKADPVRYEAFKAKSREYALRWYHNRTEEQKERDKVRKKKWRMENPDKKRQAVQRWRDKNREHYRAYNRKWREEHPDKIIEYKRRSLERQLEKLKDKNSAKSLQETK